MHICYLLMSQHILKGVAPHLCVVCCSYDSPCLARIPLNVCALTPSLSQKLLSYVFFLGGQKLAACILGVKVILVKF